jgi:hypothetical protein
MSARRDILPTSLPPRLLTRELAAAYLSVSTYILDCMVADGRMPQPKVVGTRLLWDRLALDRAVDSLPDKRGRVDVEERWKCAV